MSLGFRVLEKSPHCETSLCYFRRGNLLFVKEKVAIVREDHKIEVPLAQALNILSLTKVVHLVLLRAGDFVCLACCKGEIRGLSVK